MDSQTTIVLIGGGIAMVIIGSLGDRARRHRPLAWHAYVPWHAMIFAGATLSVLLAGHLLTLLRG